MINNHTSSIGLPTDVDDVFVMILVGANAVKNQVRAELQAEKEAMETSQKRAAARSNQVRLVISESCGSLDVIFWINLQEMKS